MGASLPENGTNQRTTEPSNDLERTHEFLDPDAPETRHSLLKSGRVGLLSLTRRILTDTGHSGSCAIY